MESDGVEVIPHFVVVLLALWAKHEVIGFWSGESLLPNDIWQTPSMRLLSGVSFQSLMYKKTYSEQVMVYPVAFNTFLKQPRHGELTDRSLWWDGY